MTEQERNELVRAFLASDVAKQGNNASLMLDLIAEAMAYSKLRDVLPDATAQKNPQPKKKTRKNGIKFNRKEINEMPYKYRHVFAQGDRIVPYRQKPNGVYEARYHREGIHIEVSSKDLTVLKKKFLEALQNYAATGCAKAKTQHTVLFNDFAQSWLTLKEKTTKPTTFKEYRRLFDHDLAPAFANKTLAEIDHASVQDFLFGYIDQNKHRTAEKLLLILRCIFDLAAEDYNFNSPMAKVVLPRHQSKKGSALTYKEEKQLVDYFIAHRELTATDALLVLLYTGMRRSELKTLRVLNEHWLECDTSKEKLGRDVVPRKIPITPMLRKVMPYIDFEKAKATGMNTINTTIKRIFPHHHTHELRYTFITRCNVRVQKGNYKKVITSKQPIQCNVKQKPSYVASDGFYNSV